MKLKMVNYLIETRINIPNLEILIVVLCITCNASICETYRDRLKIGDLGHVILGVCWMCGATTYEVLTWTDYYKGLVPHDFNLVNYLDVLLTIPLD